MGKRILVLLASAALSLVSFGATGTLPASAQPACPSPVTSNTTLKSDCIAPSPGGIVIAADKVHLNGAGHKVSCLPTPPTGNVGVSIPNHRDVHLTNMTILHCGTGIDISGGGDNKITNVNVFNNPACPLGSGGAGSADNPFPRIGLHLTKTDGNHVESSAFSCNRIGVQIENSKDNTFESNTINKNIDPATCGGVFVAGSSTGNVIRSSIFLKNGDFAVALGLFSTGADKNTVQSSTLNDTGFPQGGPFPGHDPAVWVFGNNNMIKANTANGNSHGVQVFGTIPFFFPPGAHGNTIKSNETNNNTISGIEVDLGSTDNAIEENRALGNSSFDLFDGNVTPPCDMNTWRNNHFGTRNQTCIH